MATRERSRSSASDVLVNIALIGVLIVVGWLAWPSLVTQFYARTAISPGLAQPTPAQITAPRQAAPAYQPAARPADTVSAAPIPGIAQNEATATALYQAAINAANAVPVPDNTDATGDSAPHIVKAVPDRQPAPAIVPTAEPLVQAESNDQFVVKSKPINPQRDHVCLHGAVWTDSGCAYPTPVQ